MTDYQQRARKLLCQFCDLDRSDYYDGLRINAGEAVEAITAALRAAPEGFVMVPVEATEQQVDAGIEQVQAVLNALGADASAETLALVAYDGMLAARPQGVE